MAPGFGVFSAPGGLSSTFAPACGKVDHRFRVIRGPARAQICKAVFFNLCRFIKITPVDPDLETHLMAQPLQVDLAKLLPFRPCGQHIEYESASSARKLRSRSFLAYECTENSSIECQIIFDEFERGVNLMGEGAGGCLGSYGSGLKKLEPYKREALSIFWRECAAKRSERVRSNVNRAEKL